MLIAYAAQGPMAQIEITAWQQSLHEIAQPGTTFYHQEAGAGFYYVSSDSPETTQRLSFLLCTR
jgi:hypothetical protein